MSEVHGPVLKLNNLQCGSKIYWISMKSLLGKHGIKVRQNNTVRCVGGTSRPCEGYQYQSHSGDVIRIMAR